MAEKPQQRLLLVGKCCGKNAACITRPYFIHFYTEIHNVWTCDVKQTDTHVSDIDYLSATSGRRTQKNNITGLLTASSAVMMESFFDKSDMDLASIDCSCRPVMSVCNRQQTKHYEMKLAVDGKPGRECLSLRMHRQTNSCSLPLTSLTRTWPPLTVAAYMSSQSVSTTTIWNEMKQWTHLIHTYKHCLQCFDAVGWAAGRASGL